MELLAVILGYHGIIDQACCFLVFAGQENDGQRNFRGWKLQDWKMTDWKLTDKSAAGKNVKHAVL